MQYALAIRARQPLGAVALLTNSAESEKTIAICIQRPVRRRRTRATSRNLEAAQKTSKQQSPTYRVAAVPTKIYATVGYFPRHHVHAPRLIHTCLFTRLYQTVQR